MSSSTIIIISSIFISMIIINIIFNGISLSSLSSSLAASAMSSLSSAATAALSSSALSSSALLSYCYHHLLNIDHHCCNHHQHHCHHTATSAFIINEKHSILSQSNINLRTTELIVMYRMDSRHTSTGVNSYCSSCTTRILFFT